MCGLRLCPRQAFVNEWIFYFFVFFDLFQDTFNAKLSGNELKKGMNECLFSWFFFFFFWSFYEVMWMIRWWHYWFYCFYEGVWLRLLAYCTIPSQIICLLSNCTQFKKSGAIILRTNKISYSPLKIILIGWDLKVDSYFGIKQNKKVDI